jgi:carbon monoxide dehydrogenase subunit G
MILRDRTYIDRMPEEVWRFIEDPLLIRSWNPGIREIIPASIGERGDGFRYRARYELGGRESNFEAEIVEYRRPDRFVLHLRGGSLRKGGYIQEIYELSESSGKTLLGQTIEAYGSGMHIFRRLWVTLLHRFARRAGRRGLTELKKLAEASPAGPGAP